MASKVLHTRRLGRLAELQDTTPVVRMTEHSITLSESSPRTRFPLCKKFRELLPINNILGNVWSVMRSAKGAHVRSFRVGIGQSRPW
jgi:hypothetical protein